MNQIKAARKGILTKEVKIISKKECVSVDRIMNDIAKGHTVVLRNNKRKTANFCAVGKGLTTKVNVNIGTSSDVVDLKEEFLKINISEKYGADAIMDLSTGGNIVDIRRKILEYTKLPVGTVPVYQAAMESLSSGKDITGIDEENVFKVIEEQAREGVDFMTLHCGVTLESVKVLEKYPRVTGIVSRGGAILYSWMKRTGKENPLYARYDRVLDIAEKYDIVLSLGDGMRPGCIQDASDKAQFGELKTLALLAEKALKRGVQVMIEGPGHVPLNQIEKNIKLQKKLCGGAPFYVLGPLVTDIAPGYDHITSAIGGTLAAYYGADFLCYVTPAEHLRLPTADDVKEGLIASKISAHAADIAKGVSGAGSRDLEISKARAKRDWKRQIELSIDPVKAKEYRKTRMPDKDDVCSMCNNFCSMKIMEQCAEKRNRT